MNQLNVSTIWLSLLRGGGENEEVVALRARVAGLKVKLEQEIRILELRRRP